jgi:hypothetical protein
MVNLEKTEALVVTGKKDKYATIALNVVSGDVRVILSDENEDKIIKPTGHFQKVGKFPCEVKISFLFYERPWKAEFGFPNGSHYSTTSAGRGLEEKVLLTPDFLEIGIIYKVEES